MKPSLERLQQFRRRLYQTFCQRADASFDLIDALAQSAQVESPVAVSQNPAFRRGYASVYDALDASRGDEEALSQLLFESVPPDSQTLADYEVYAVDATLEERPAAETLPDRTLVRSREQEPSVPGHSYAWLVRLIERGTSWAAPLAVRRVSSAEKSFQVAAEQVLALDQRSDHKKVVVADSGYINWAFLQLCLIATTVVVLVRMRANQVLYGPPAPYQGRGRKPKHGPALRLKGPAQPAEREETLTWLSYTIRLRAWCNLHFRKLPDLCGMVICVQVLRPDGTPRYPRPLWLFWSGPSGVALADLYNLYQWRFVIEHLFRFLKQHLGLNRASLVHGQSPQQWMRLCALAYWQLLLARPLVAYQPLPWQRKPSLARPPALTPRQVQNALPGIFGTIGTPAQPPKPAGKAPGRAPGFHPKPRTRYPVIRKSRKPAQTPIASAG